LCIDWLGSHGRERSTVHGADRPIRTDRQLADG
jgi:hypothetical protein